jgi:hypothetical protein
VNWYRRAQTEITDEDIEEFGKSKWIPVDSSFIKSVAYYEPLGMFEVLLESGREYSFADVPKKTFDAFMQATSKGRFFNEVIKKNYGVQKK